MRKVLVGIIPNPYTERRCGNGKPKEKVHTVNRFLQDNPDSFDLVEWVLFDTHTESVYEAEVDKLYDK